MEGIFPWFLPFSSCIICWHHQLRSVESGFTVKSDQNVHKGLNTNELVVWWSSNLRCIPSCQGWSRLSDASIQATRSHCVIWCAGKRWWKTYGATRSQVNQTPVGDFRGYFSCTMIETPNKGISHHHHHHHSSEVRLVNVHHLRRGTYAIKLFTWKCTMD